MATLVDGCQPLTTNVQFTPILTFKMIVPPTFFIDGEYEAHFSITVRLFQQPFSFWQDLVWQAKHRYLTGHSTSSSKSVVFAATQGGRAGRVVF